MDEKPSNLKADPKPWMALYETLGKLLEAIPPTDWRPTFPKTTRPPPDAERLRFYVQVLMEAFWEHELLTMKHVVWFLREGQLADMPPPVVYHLRLMLGATRLFVQDTFVGVRDTVSTILPFPKGEEIEVIYWFLTEWWSANGLQRYAQLASERLLREGR